MKNIKDFENDFMNDFMNLSENKLNVDSGVANKYMKKIYKELLRGKKIAIVGDYDVDGFFSAIILKHYLKLLTSRVNPELFLIGEKMKKHNKLTMAFILLIFIGFANANEKISKSDFIYQNAVNDTLAIGERFFSNLNLITKKNNGIYINGYAVMLNVTSFPESKIIKASAIGLKTGLDIKYISYKNNDYIVFATEKRKADANFLKSKLNKFGLMPSVVKLDNKYDEIVLVANNMIYAIKNSMNYIFKDKDERIARLEEALEKKATTISSKPLITRSSSPKIVLDLKSLQVVNRVVTEKYLKAKNKTVGKNLEALNKHAQKSITSKKVKAQIRTLKTNIKKDVNKKLPQISSFPKIYGYLKAHSGITKENYLVLHGKAYKKGSKLLRWTISDINYGLGIVVLDDNYNVPVARK